MSSTLVSSYIEFGERFLHEDLSTPDTMGYYIDPAAQNQKSSVFDKDLPAYSGFSTAGRPPVSRRHSSSVYSPVSTKSTQLQTLAESGLLGNILTGALETVVEERYRSRAFSEGSAVLGEPLQEHQGQSGTSRYKTELCRPFEENGKCKYGDKCQFAHGKHELRHMVRHPKYKTELCRTFHTSGLCPYGPRCHFIHNQDDHAAEVQRQTSLNAKASATVPVPILGQTQRRNSTNNSSRPSNLQLLSQQRGINRLGSYSYSPTHVNSPLDAFYGVNEAALLSPISPLGKTNGQFFNYGKLQMSPPDRTNGFGMAGKSEYRQTTPPPTQFDSQGQVSESPVNDDIVFVGPPTPPDSDRESATGSPPGFGSVSAGPQRLPIFRCLSQSE